MDNIITKICLSLAVIITVYNFFITDEPVHMATGVVLILLIIANVPRALKEK